MRKVAKAIKLTPTFHRDARFVFGCLVWLHWLQAKWQGEWDSNPRCGMRVLEARAIAAMRPPYVVACSVLTLLLSATTPARKLVLSMESKLLMLNGHVATLLSRLRSCGPVTRLVVRIFIRRKSDLQIRISLLCKALRAAAVPRSAAILL